MTTADREGRRERETDSSSGRIEGEGTARRRAAVADGQRAATGTLCVPPTHGQDDSANTMASRWLMGPRPGECAARPLEHDHCASAVARLIRIFMRSFLSVPFLTQNFEFIFQRRTQSAEQVRTAVLNPMPQMPIENVQKSCRWW